MRVALARAAAVPAGFDDDRRLADALRGRGVEAALVVWNDPAAAWDGYDLVIVRSTWDYSHQLERFLAWADAIGERLRNRPAILRWNSDKRYLADLRRAGIPVVDTAFVAPGERGPALSGEVVIKPAVSAGARDTGRFGPAAHAAGRALLARLSREQRTAMVQPYIGSVEERGETAVVFLGRRESHVLRKQPVLAPDEQAPVRDDALGAAEAMYRGDLVTAGEATAAERSVARSAVAYLTVRFGSPPLYARVDLLSGRDAQPVVLELEAVEPNLYFNVASGAADVLAGLIAAGARP